MSDTRLRMAVTAATLVLVALLAGCGSGTRSHSSTTATGRRDSTAVPVGPAPKAPLDRLPADAVALAAGQPITRATLVHWMFIDARGQTPPQPDMPMIVPTDPPRFVRCVRAVRRSMPALGTVSTRTLQSDCQELFGTLERQTLDFLIRSDWYRALAAQLGITPSAVDVARELDAAHRQSFVSEADYRLFLAQSRETTADIRLRVLIDEIVVRLQAREHGSAARRNAAVTELVTRLYRSTTRCAPLYRISDCG